MGLFAVAERVRELGGRIEHRDGQPCGTVNGQSCGTVFEVRLPIAASSTVGVA